MRISAFEINAAGTYRIVTSSTNLTPVKGEWNVNVAGAWFPYDRYIGAFARNSVDLNGGVNDLIIGSPEVVYGSTFIDCTPDGSGGCAANGGKATVDLRSLGIDSQTDGILLVNGAKDEACNYALSRAQADGTWTIYVKNGAGNDANNWEQDYLAFVYIPRTDTFGDFGEAGRGRGHYDV